MKINSKKIKNWGQPQKENDGDLTKKTTSKNEKGRRPQKNEIKTTFKKGRWPHENEREKRPK